MHRRTFLLSALAAGVALPRSVTAQPAPAMDAEEAALYAKAKQEGQVTWYVGQLTGEQADLVADAFSKRYPGIKVTVIRAAGQVIYARLNQDIRGGTPQCDLFGSTERNQLLGIKQKNLLLKWRPRNMAKVLDAFKTIDPDGTFFATAINPIVMSYSTKAITDPASAPKNWTDFLDPKWSGKMAVSHPGFSGSTAEWLVLMEKLYGADFIPRLAKQNPLIGRSMTDPIVSVANNERTFGLANITAAAPMVLAGNPLALIYPSDGALVTAFGSAVLANAPHPAAGQLLMEFLLSESTGTMLVQKFGMLPIRSDVASPAGMKALADIKLADIAIEEIQTNVPKVIERWRDVFGG